MSAADDLAVQTQHLSIVDSIHDDFTFSISEGPPFDDPFDLDSLNNFEINVKGTVITMDAITSVMCLKSSSVIDAQNGESNVSNVNVINMYVLAVPFSYFRTIKASHTGIPNHAITLQDYLVFVDCKRSKYPLLYEKLKNNSNCDDWLRAGCKVRWYRGQLVVNKELQRSISVDTVNALEKAFNAPFKSHRDAKLSVLDQFIDYLNFSFKEWRKGNCKYLVMLLSIVQSSGSGKTRLVKELHECGKYEILYICCRDPKVNSYPKTSSCYNWFAEQFLQSTDPVNCCKKFLFSLMVAFESLTTEKPNTKRVPMSSDIEDLFFSKVTQAANTSGVDLDIKAADSLQRLAKENKPFLIVLDEAQSLLNLINTKSSTNALVEICRILYNTNFVVRTNYFATIVLDTLSTVSNFATTPSDQSSGRLYNKNEYCTNLFQPFYSFTNYSVLSYPAFTPENIRQIPSIMSPRGKTQLMDLVNHPHRHLALTTIGRPLWAATFRAAANMSDNDTFEQLSDPSKIAKGLNAVTEMASLKLACGYVEYHDGCASTLERMFLTSVACFSVTTGMAISGSTTYAKKLMSSHAGWLSFISANRSWLEVGYMQELALVEQSLLWQEDYMDSMLLDLNRACSERLIDSGTKGEWFTTILLVSARHSALLYPPKPCLRKSPNAIACTFNIGSHVCKQVLTSRIAPKVKLAEFLCMLGIPVKCWQNDLFGSLSVNCSHFIQAASLPTENMMRTALVYGHGFMLPPRTPGVDVIVPYVDNEGKLGLLSVNSKCYSEDTADKPYYETVVQKLSPSYIWNTHLPTLKNSSRNKSPIHSPNCPFLTASVPYIGILIQFGGGPRKTLVRDLCYYSDGSMRACVVVPDESAVPCLKMYYLGNHNDENSIKSIILDSVRNCQLVSTWKEKETLLDDFLVRADNNRPSFYEDVTVNDLGKNVKFRILTE